MLRGVVDRVVPDGGFGFVIGPNGEEYFFHRSALVNVAYEELAEGVPVHFNVGEDPGDTPEEHLRAVNVRLTDDAIPAVDNEPLPPEKL